MMCRGKQNTVLLVKEVIRHLGISGKDGLVCPFNIGLLCSAVVLSCQAWETEREHLASCILLLQLITK